MKETSGPGPDVADPAPAARFAVLGGVVLAVAAVLSLFAHVRVSGGVIDDAYITFRYAANLATGRGMVYNPGEAVLGTTTPGWAALLGTLGRLTGPDAIPLAARLLNGLLLVASGLVTARLAVVLTGSRLVAGLAGAAVLLGPFSLIASISGMESALLDLLVLTALLGVAEARWTLAAAAAGAAPLVRPEGLLIVAVVGVAWALAFRPGRRPAPTRAVPALLLVPGIALLAWMRLAYGHFVPQSLRAKEAGIYPLGVGGSAGETVRSLRGALTGAGVLDVVTGVHLLVLAAGSAWLLARRRDLWPAVVLLWGYLVFYATSGTAIFPHYVALVEPFALLAWGAAAWAAVAWGLRRFGATGGAGVTIRATVAAGVFVLARPLALYPVASILSGEPNVADEAVGLPAVRLAFYRATAEAVGPAIPPGTTVLMPEIGVLGFHLRHVRVVDAAGLVTPAAVPYLPVPAEERVGPGVGAIPAGLVREAEPDLVITLELFARRSAYDDPWFEERYASVWRWGSPDLVWGPLRIHARDDFAPGAALRALPGGVQEGEPGPTPSTPRASDRSARRSGARSGRRS